MSSKSYIFKPINRGEIMENNDKLQGLGGWLILVGIGVVLSPIRLLYTYVPAYVPIFEDGTWEALTSNGSELYDPLWAPFLIGEIFFNSIILVASVYLIYLFFSKHHLFPKVYIGIVVVSLILIPLDAWVITIILPTEPMFVPETTKELVQTSITALIWIPYMLISKRVKATFVEKGPNKQIHQIDSESETFVEKDPNKQIHQIDSEIETYVGWLKQMKNFKGGKLGGLVIFLTISSAPVFAWYGIEIFPSGEYSKIVLALPGLALTAAFFFVLSAALWPIKNK